MQELTNGHKTETKAPGIQISDDEGLVDKRTKQHILSLRREVDNDERELFVNKFTDPEADISYAEAVQHWSVSVKQYLRAIKRLWNDGGDQHHIKNVEHYWNSVKIYEQTLTPPDKGGYRFSLIGQPGISSEDVRRMLGLPSDVTVPQPQTVTITGLQEVLERQRIGHTWTVYIDKSGPPPAWEQLVLQQEQPLPKELLERAVEVAQDFLQQAGIGFKIGDDLPNWGFDEMENARERDDIEVV